MSIASRITSIEGHISDIYDSVELTGVDTTDIDKNLVNVPNTLKEGYIDIINNGTDTLYNNFPKVSGEGTSLTLNNTYQAPMRNNLKGNTSQITTTQSSNLFDEKKYLTETFTTGTYKYALANFKGNRTLYVKSKLKEGKSVISGLYVAISTVGSNPNSGIAKFAIFNGNVSAGDTSKDFTGYDNLYIAYYPTSKTWEEILDVYDIWVSTNNVNYTPFVPNSPSPDYPQDVDVVSGDNTINVIGKNLFGGFEFSRSSASVTFTTHKDGSITMSGTSTATTYSLGTSDISTYKKTLVAGTYTLSGGTSSINLVVTDSSGTTLCNTNGGNSVTFTLNSDTDIVVRANVPKGTVTNTTVYPMLSTSGGDYEPYQGNTYNIDLPVENLLDANNIEFTPSGINWYGLNGSTLNNPSQITNTSIGVQVKANKTYTFSIDSKSNVARIQLVYVSGTSFATFGSTITTDTFRTFTPTTDTIVYPRVEPTTSGTKLTCKFQIEEGSKANTFTPYGTKPIELCKIGNYQDYFYKDSGKWYLHKEIGKVVLNGSETWRLQNASVGQFIISNSTMTNNIGFSDNFIIKTSYSSDDKPYLRPSNGNLYAEIGTDFLSEVSVDAWTTWLSNNNTNLYYVLATPTSEGIPTNLINQLEELYIAKSKENQTNISQINNDLGFIISASALKKGV